ncbi:MAG: FtsW/RodA/SpoVE family cell cycle protein [Lachnospiraceae bacterium]
MLKQYHLKNYRFGLIFTVIALSIIGILIIGSAKESVQRMQVYGLILGLIIMVVVSLIDYSFILRFSWILYFLNLILLVSVKLFGDAAGGAVRWISFGGVRFQPSELAKIILILFFAAFFSKYKEELNTFQILAATAVLMLVPLVLILIEPDLSTTIVTAMVCITLLFVAGLSYKIIGVVLAIFIPVFAIASFAILNYGDSLVEKFYQLRRIMAWLHPEDYPDLALQQQNSVMAIGSGQLIGKGLNNNVVSSVKNGNFILEPQTDFIFAVAGEELGFVGSVAIVILLFLIALQCILIGRRAKDLAGRIICCGVASVISYQGFVNICVATNLFPNTGLTLPFVSYGLTSLISLFIGIGLVLNVGLQQSKYGGGILE